MQAHDGTLTLTPRTEGGLVVTVLLPPGELTMTYSRGPEYRQIERKVFIPQREAPTVEVKLERWVNPADHGWYSGDHHIHAAGCAHYTSPTEGVFAQDMFLHVKGEGLNVGCNLTWGPCYDFQRQFFEPTINKLSEPLTVLKYDIEVSGFGSQALGHVCLLNLKDQTYPGSDGTKEKGWPTWTTPLMKWAKAQGAYTGYAHSASGLDVNPAAAANRQLRTYSDARVSRIGKRLAAHAPGARYPYEFRVVGDNAINAFALPGGFVYINRGALQAARSEDEVAAVIAHEIAHVALRHGTNQASKAYLAQAGLGLVGGLLGGRGNSGLGQVMGAVGGFGLNTLFLKHSRTAEQQADSLGMQMLRKAGYDPRGMISFLQTIQRHSGARSVEFLSSHPNPSNRIARLEKQLASQR